MLAASWLFLWSAWLLSLPSFYLPQSFKNIIRSILKIQQKLNLHKLNKHIKQKLSAGSKAFMKWYFQAPPYWSSFLFIMSSTKGSLRRLISGINIKIFCWLVFLVCSVFLTFWFDRIFVHLKTISSEQKASVRLISAFYIILILLYIKFIYNDSNYDSLIFYFVMLAIGRFVYFDSTLDYIKESLKSVVKYLPLLILMGAYSGFICWYGFPLISC